jgi:hypothetical protein
MKMEGWERMETMILPQSHVRAGKGVWGKNGFLMRRVKRSSPTSPTSPFPAQYVDIAGLHPLPPVQFILSLSISILSIPSLFKEQNQDLAISEKVTTISGRQALQ